jgi:hypothetical protein
MRTMCQADKRPVLATVAQHESTGLLPQDLCAEAEDLESMTVSQLRAQDNR